ncbi:DUF892 family protein [Mucilaginibacter sp. 21P]|uniref:DUF892 family protein n=1 Tax=Mucilaginibacter sp. 21P TaxID=2778902 RepID=UPI001C592E91|nr:DUF892 family protein [Mucilaginibacter sp. 21P]QXV65015.1 DUF892 family protein [Mucilaginibacter sp. 21P]
MTTSHNTNAATLKRIFLHHLNRIYSGKCILRKHADSLIEQASFKGLKLALQEFAGDVVKQIKRMEEIYTLVNESPSAEQCNPISNMVNDDFCMDDNQDLPVLNDLDLMLYVQILEHINITSYRMLMMLAKQLNYSEVTQILTENLDDSADNDKLFTLIAREYITKDKTA